MFKKNIQIQRTNQNRLLFLKKAAKTQKQKIGPAYHGVTNGSWKAFVHYDSGVCKMIVECAQWFVTKLQKNKNKTQKLIQNQSLKRELLEYEPVRG